MKKKAIVKDERTQQATHKIATHVYILWFFLLTGDLLYRQLYLGQRPGQYWDIALILVLGTTYFTIRSASQGLFLEVFKKRGAMGIFIGLAAGLSAAFFARKSASASVGEFLLRGTVGLLTAFLIFLLLYFLQCRWEKKNDLR